jgi:hypothetical protein
MKFVLHTLQATCIVLLIAACVQEIVGQRCRLIGHSCRDTGPFFRGNGRCARSRPSLSCIRIGRKCRCRPSIILNITPPPQVVDTVGESTYITESM